MFIETSPRRCERRSGGSVDQRDKDAGHDDEVERDEGDPATVEPPSEAMEDRHGVALAQEVTDGLDRCRPNMSTSSGAATKPAAVRRCSKNPSGSDNAEIRIHAA